MYKFAKVFPKVIAFIRDLIQKITIVGVTSTKQ